MMLFRTALFLCPLALAPGQTTTQPLSSAGTAGPTVTLSVEKPPEPPQMPAVAPDTVVLTVGGEKITARQFEQIVDALPEQYRNFARSAGRKQFAEQIVRVKLLAAEGRRLKIDQDAAYKAQLAFQTENLLAGMAFLDISKNVKVDEAAARKYYEEHKTEYERAHARHILVRMKGSPVPVTPGQEDLSEEQALAKAKALRAKIASGADFAKIAEAESDDAGSRAAGGDLGFFRHGQMVPSFEEAAFKLKPKELSEPVKSPFGYHVIRLEEIEIKTFEQALPEIEKRMRPELAQKSVEDMKAKANVTLDPVFFGEPKPAAPAAPKADK